MTGTGQSTVGIARIEQGAVDVVGTLLQAQLDAVIPTPSENVIVIGGFVALVVLIGLSAFFSSSEIAMFSLARHRMDALAENGGSRGQLVAKLRENPHRLLVTILVGNNIANIAMSAIATGLLGILDFSPGESVLIATFGITSVVLLFGESAPKSYAVENAETWSLRNARPLQVTQYVLYPLVVVFDYLTRAISRLTGGASGIETAYVTRSEILDIIETGETQGVIEAGEADILERVFDFTSTTAREVMVPRPDVAAVPVSATLDEAIDVSIDSRHHRLPVYEDELDRILGVVSVIDLIEARNWPDADLRDLAMDREPLMVPETKPIDHLLEEMREERYHVAVVVDEFGAFEGLLTTEDVTEALVGAILKRDEPSPIRHVAPGLATVRGDLAVDELNWQLGFDPDRGRAIPESEDYDTIAGFVLDRLGRLPEVGESVTHDGIRITVERIENARIVRLRVAWEELDDDLGDEAETG